MKNGIQAQPQLAPPDDKLLTRPWVVFALALTTCVLWGSAFPSIKIGYNLFQVAADDTAGKLLFAGYRFTLSGILLLIFCSATGKRPFSLHLLDFGRVALLGLIMTTLQYTFFYIALSNTSGVKGAIMNGTTTFFSVLLAHFAFKGEHLTRRVSLGCLVGFAGVVSVNISPGMLDFGFRLTGEGFMLLSSVVMAVASVYGKIISQQMDTVTMTAWHLTIGGFVLLCIGLACGGQLPTFSTQGGMLLVYLSCVSSLGFAITAALMKHNPISRVSIFQFTIPLFGAGLSALLLHETLLEWKNLVALVCVCIGIYLTTHTARPKPAHSAGT